MVGTVFVAITLTLIVFLTQSLRFLEIILESNTSGGALWTLTTLALPRFFEIILPLALMTATLFIYNKMTMDSELVAIRAVGHSPLSLAKPALLLGGIMTVFLWVNAMWVAPSALSKMQQMRMSLTAEFSNVLFREGVFNQVGKGLTVYIHKRNNDGELSGLMIYDSREKNKSPSTVLAKSGVIVAGEDGQQVVVFDVIRQEFDHKSQILQNLTTERYTIDIPTTAPRGNRWQEPDERTITELLNPDMENKRDRENLHEFFVELHRRIASPLLALAFPLIALTCLLMGEMERRGLAKRIMIGVFLTVLTQALFLAAYNMTKHSSIGIVIMYLLAIGPTIGCLFLLSPQGEEFRRKVFFRASAKGAA